MSPKSFARLGKFALFALVASCGDATRITGPAELQRVELPPAHAASCTINWVNPAGGDWGTITNWNPARIPTATDDVCITLPGDYTVLSTVATTVNTLTVGVDGVLNRPTLTVRAQYATNTLTASNGMINYGYMATFGLFGTISNQTGANLAVTNGTLVNYGTIRTFIDGVGAPRIITANVLNLGTVYAEQFLTLNKPGGIFENRGDVIAAPRALLVMSGGLGQTFRQTAGTLQLLGGSSDASNFTINNERFEFDGGTTVGFSPIITNGSLSIGSGNTNAGSFIVRGITAFSGDVAAAQTIDAQALFPSNTVMKSATGFTNAGTIILSWTFGGNNQTRSTLEVTDGVFTNTGTLHMVTDGIGAPRSINADVNNLGTIKVDQVTTFGKAGGVLENRGAITIATGKQLNFPTAEQTYRQAAGTLEMLGSGSMTITNGTFEGVGGTITGVPNVNAGTVRFAAGATGSGSLLLRGTGSKISGDIPVGWTVTAGNLGNVDGVIAIDEGSTIRGTLALQHVLGADNFTDLTLVAGTLTNAGTFATSTGSLGGTMTVSANLVNTGTVSVGNRLILAKQDGAHVNNGNIVFGGTTRAMQVWGMNQTFTTTGTVSGSGIFDFKDMTLKASGTAAARFTLNNVAAHIGANGPAKLDVFGSWTMQNGGSLNVEIATPAPGVGHDQLNLTGNDLTNNGTVFMTGTLNATAVAGACVDPGQTFEIMTYRVRSGDFATKNLSLGGGRALTAAAGTTSYKLSSTGPACPLPDNTPPVISPAVTGTLGQNGWYTSDVGVTWSVSDVESAVSSTTGCEASSLTSDAAGVTYTCSATSAGGTSSQSVTIKRDATPPVIEKDFTVLPNANGWYNVSFGVRLSITDAMSGPPGGVDVIAFTQEGANQSQSRTHYDNAGNAATATVSGINIDMTPPVVSAMRAPAANANGWNNSNVTATYSATDALSGLDGSAGATQLFSLEGANQGGSHVFTDLAGNSATASIGGISIDKTVPTVSVTRSPLPDATGWNNTSVTATWTATDALSGIDGAATATQLFDQDGASQSGTKSFSDLAGNSASATISGININTAPPPPPPPTNVSCSVTPNEIWPPNNKMVPVRVTVAGGIPKLVSVTNNETGTADVEGWSIGTADLDGSVRATRNGGGVGRTYTIKYDVGGTSCAVTVRVPHDQRK